MAHSFEASLGPVQFAGGEASLRSAGPQMTSPDCSSGVLHLGQRRVHQEAALHATQPMMLHIHFPSVHEWAAWLPECCRVELAALPPHLMVCPQTTHLPALLQGPHWWHSHPPDLGLPSHRGAPPDCPAADGAFGAGRGDMHQASWTLPTARLGWCTACNNGEQFMSWRNPFLH